VLAERVSTWVPAAEPVANEAVTPPGIPRAVSATVPENLPASVTVIVLVPLLPWEIDTTVGEADREKPPIWNSRWVPHTNPFRCVVRSRDRLKRREFTGEAATC
jgi:hypothetical protein